jgi:ABC-2 type transport system permease protein
MTLLAVERIKLFTTRSPFWCMFATLVVTTGLAALITSTAPDYLTITVATTQFGYNFGLMVVMVMAVLAVTTEYRFSTIRTTFQAAPNRTAVLLAKTGVVGILAGLLGVATAFASWGIGKLIRPHAALALDNAAHLRLLLGMGLIYLIGAVVAISVGMLVRHTAGAVSIVLIYSLLVESIVRIIPRIGDDLARWAPFNVGKNFLIAGDKEAYEWIQVPPDIKLDAWASLGYFAGFAALLLAIALYTANRRDA